VTRLAGSAVVITGASSGIGAQLARELSGRGARVGLVARRAERLEELAAELEGGPGAAWAAADVTDGAGLCAALDRLEEELGGTDVVIANAGTNRLERPHEPGVAVELYDLNVAGMLRLFDWALPRFLQRRRGHLVGISSVASFFGLPGNAAYCGSKAAMRIHLQALRVTLKRRGIAVTTICPGFVESELTDDFPGPMPFLWPTDRAARTIADAVEAGRGEVVFPWQMRWIVRGSRLLPRPLFEWVLTRGAQRRGGPERGP
jgi:short-subunit dehydrogenase